MKKDKKAKPTRKDELRAVYKRSDFPKGLVRGKYAERLHESSNVVVLKPKVARAFANEDAVNNALLSLIEIAKRTARLTNHPTKRAKRRAGSLRRRPKR